MAESNRRDQLMKTLLRFDKKNNNGNSNTKSDVEMRVLEELCDIGLRSNKAEDNFDVDTSLFKEFTEKVKNKCPFLTSIIEALVIGSNSCQRNTHKTAQSKLLCGHHALAFLLNVRNSNCFNDFPLLFGLVCMSYGAGKQLVKHVEGHWTFSTF